MDFLIKQMLRIEIRIEEDNEIFSLTYITLLSCSIIHYKFILIFNF